MKKDDSFHQYVMFDLLANIAGISSKAMFGGWGIYQAGVIFAIIADGQLYFKTSDTNRPDFEKLSSKPFVYEMPNGKKTTTSYWLLPEEVIERKDEAELATWIEKAVSASKTGKKSK